MDLTNIFNIIIALLGALITTFLIPYLNSKTTAQQQDNIMLWVDIAVSAAEQLFSSTQGEEKLEYVINYLETKSIYVTREEIESSVYWLHAVIDDGLDKIEE